jgi:signal transduction histidine kinase
MTMAERGAMKTESYRFGSGNDGPPAGPVQAALDALDCQVAVLTPDGEVVVVNEAWRRLAESDLPSATHVPPGRNYLQAFNDRGLMCREAREAAAGVSAVLSRRLSQFSTEYPCHTGSQKHWFEVNATACDISGSPHTIVVQRSITFSKELEERLRQEAERLVLVPPATETENKVEELQALLIRKEEFLATLLHELRNPLAPIANALELLGRHPGDTDLVARARGIIQRQLRQITRLVDDLFDASRIHRKNIEMRRARVDIAEVIAESIETAQPLIDLRRHALTTSVSLETFFVHADSMRLGQVLTNLLINAAKYTNPGGHISVIVEAADANVLIRVRDSGVGIAPEHLSEVFELFAQPACGSNARMGGLGIGLAVARELMRLQGGSITVQSEGLGCGSEFIVSLPRADDSVGEGA